MKEGFTVPHRNVFVLGLDDVNLEILQGLPGADEYRFHTLVPPDEILDLENLDFEDLLEKTHRHLEDFDGTVDAIIGYWDFPVSSLVPLLGERLGLPSPNLRAVVACEHKYWSRRLQARAIDEVPAFASVQLDDPRPPEGVGYPMWLKPVKSASSALAIKVEDPSEFDAAIAEIESGIDEYGVPFDQLLGHIELPPEIAEVGGRACLAEAAATGRQATVEGYMVDGRATVYGVVDSVLYPDSPSFHHYEYPSHLPGHVTERLSELSRRVMEEIDLGSGSFNIEWFWDPDTDRIALLEVNPRHSQSHAALFEHVDGVANHHVMLQLGLGNDPTMPTGEGPYGAAGRFWMRHFNDAVVRKAPDRARLEQVQEEIPGVSFDMVVEEGTRLSELPHQDAYSYELAVMVVAARDHEELQAKYERVVEALAFELDDIEED